MPPSDLSSIVQSDTAVVQAATDALEQSAYKDMFLSFTVAAMVIVYVLKNIIPMLRGKSESKNGDEVTKIITQKDEYGRPILLGIVPMLCGFTKSMDGFTNEIRNLVNHQQETNMHSMEIIENMNDTVNQTLRVVEELRKH